MNIRLVRSPPITVIKYNALLKERLLTPDTRVKTPMFSLPCMEEDAIQLALI